MYRKHIQPVLNWFKQAITEPQHELGRWERAVRYAYDLGIHGWKALNRDNAPQMAAALSFRTLFALLPVVVVSAVLVKAVQGVEGFQRLVVNVVSAVGLDKFKISGTEDGSAQSLGTWAEEVVGQLSSINLSALGWIGVLVLVYSAISLMVTIENSFNSIYGAPEGRWWSRRVPIYWTVLTIGPAFIALTFWVDRQFAGFIDGVQTWGWLLTAVKYIWGLGVAWLLMFAVYKFLPNTKVNNKAALVGAFVSAVFLTAGRNVLGAYFEGAFSIQSLYGALGAIPIFMFWVYLMWLLILFGLEVSATIQALAGREFEELEEKRPQNGLVDPASVLNVMEVVTERFVNGLATETREIADQTLIPENMVCQMVDRLVKESVLHRVSGASEDAVTLAQPPDRISADRLIEIGYALVDEAGVGRQSALLQRLREAQKSLAQQATLASLLPATSAVAPASQVR